ncbi:MAG: hypothetical protein Q4C60_08520 [Eubacteriales bacterium]|nr:hypothetical protein [Eubacteriales bacterium]
MNKNTPAGKADGNVGWRIRVVLLHVHCVECFWYEVYHRERKIKMEIMGVQAINSPQFMQSFIQFMSYT